MKLTLFLLLTVIIAAGCSKPANVNTAQVSPAPQGTATPDPLAFARKNYAKHCVECHGGQGQGGTVTVDNAKLKVPSLTEGHALKHSDEDFVDQINEGGDGMPKFKDKLSAAEVNDLVRFVRHEFQGK
ncbi:MAG TPA: cytochrome c [Pyrinomonadaceae bacterium]|nr:cytochrome c [Pyrinomonadaceae bacterium]